jgi:hypothetical protein
MAPVPPLLPRQGQVSKNRTANAKGKLIKDLLAEMVVAAVRHVNFLDTSASMYASAPPPTPPA